MQHIQKQVVLMDARRIMVKSIKDFNVFVYLQEHLTDNENSAVHMDANSLHTFISLQVC